MASDDRIGIGGNRQSAIEIGPVAGENFGPLSSPVAWRSPPRR
jgi:hypothetical protein